MWQKVTNKEQLQNLQSEDVLIKYPVDGNVADSFDNANPENISPRIVTGINATEEKLVLGFIQSQQRKHPILGMYRSVLAPVEKTYYDLIAERIWWVFKEE